MFGNETGQSYLKVSKVERKIFIIINTMETG